MNNTLVIMGLVGLVLVCGGLFVVAAATLFRLTGHHVVAFFELLGRSAKEDQQDERTVITSPKPNLRAIAQAHDFDSALARRIVQDESEPRTTQTPNAPVFPDARPRLGSRRSTPEKPLYDRPQDDEDDALADFLDNRS